jgi:hypothetical protein
MHFKIDIVVEQASCPVHAYNGSGRQAPWIIIHPYYCSIRRNYAFMLNHVPLVHTTGLALMSHISLAYWAMVRSLLNLPLPAVFKMDILVHFFLSLSCNQAFSFRYQTIKGRGKRRISRLCRRYDHYIWEKRKRNSKTAACNGD